VQPEEIRCLNVIKIILDGGWTIRDKEFEEIMDVSGLNSALEELQKEKDALKLRQISVVSPRLASLEAFSEKLRSTLWISQF